MRPIAPPPRRPRSRMVHREGELKRESKDGPPVESWLPFGDDLQSSSTDSIEDFIYKDDDEVAIVTSCSGEDSDEIGNIEMQLNKDIGNWGTAFNEDGLLDLAPVPLPSCPPCCIDSGADIRKDSFMDVRNKTGLPSRLSRASSLPRSQKVVQTKGLTKRRKDSSKIEERGQIDADIRGRSVSSNRSRSIPIQKTSFATKLKTKIDRPGRRRSRSVLRFATRHATLEVPEHIEDGSENPSIGRREMKQSHPSQDESRSDEAKYPFDEGNVINRLNITSAAVQVGSETVTASVCLPRPIHTRNLLATSVYHNQATGIWITTINMSQKEYVNKSNAAKYLKAFSFQTESEARESAYANAPAKMLPFDEHHFCFTCSAQFSVFKRASHCRNCGVCVCNTCSVLWSKESIPETYNIKGESSIRVCKSCDSLSKMFRRSLIEANYEDAITIYNTGNINLRCPFITNKGEEAMLPIHCAAEGGSLDILQWLVEVHFCPLKRIRTGNKNKSQHADELITTSKGRSVLEISMANQNVDILRYLVNDKNIAVVGIRDLNVALKALEVVLRSPLVQNESTNVLTPVQRAFAAGPGTPKFTRIENGLPSFAISDIDDCSDCSDESSSRNVECALGSDDDESVATTVHDACIICYENSIDCVITPCGHQICCLQCSKNLTACPVCNANCKFIRIFRP